MSQSNTVPLFPERTPTSCSTAHPPSRALPFRFSPLCNINVPEERARVEAKLLSVVRGRNVRIASKALWNGAVSSTLLGKGNNDA